MKSFFTRGVNNSIVDHSLQTPVVNVLFPPFWRQMSLQVLIELHFTSLLGLESISDVIADGVAATSPAA
jgi:hypothetical protein